MSHLGREYLEDGRPIEIVLPTFGVRFILINEGTDILCETSDDFPSMMNWFNELYGEDCSKKTGASARTKAEKSKGRDKAVFRILERP
ncbi:recombinase family protein [Anaerotignum neopropionicum]|uniref:hypothetical protein n=1 Tax=Anaerotignum neopropionicum TaxID=36847 RepID=UPI00082711D7|nr:hypothetical protein [Anaerotignum neopropionicum]